MLKATSIKSEKKAMVIIKMRQKFSNMEIKINFRNKDIHYFKKAVFILYKIFCIFNSGCVKFHPSM